MRLAAGWLLAAWVAGRLAGQLAAWTVRRIVQTIYRESATGAALDAFLAL